MAKVKKINTHFKTQAISEKPAFFKGKNTQLVVRRKVFFGDILNRLNRLSFFQNRGRNSVVDGVIVLRRRQFLLNEFIVYDDKMNAFDYEQRNPGNRPRKEEEGEGKDEREEESYPNNSENANEEEGNDHRYDNAVHTA